MVHNDPRSDLPGRDPTEAPDIAAPALPDDDLTLDETLLMPSPLHAVSPGDADAFEEVGESELAVPVEVEHEVEVVPDVEDDDPGPGAEPPGPPSKRRGLKIALGCLGTLVALAVVAVVGLGVIAVVGTAATVGAGYWAISSLELPDPPAASSSPGQAGSEALELAEEADPVDAIARERARGIEAADEAGSVDDAGTADQVEAGSEPGPAAAAEPATSETVSSTARRAPPSSARSGRAEASTEAASPPPSSRSTTQETADAPTPGGAVAGASRSPASVPEGWSRVSFSGAERAVLVRGSDRIRLPAAVEPARYDVLVTFPGEDEVEVARIRVRKDTPVTIACNAAMGLCRAQ